jgi:trk system potassium uptake protein TrkA
MRVAFVGAGNLSVMTARNLLDHGHEVVIIEQDKGRIDELSDTMDCGFLHGDGSRPAVLRQADPEHTDVLFCLTGNDQTNIIASLVGRSLGFSRVVTKVEDPELEHICTELGLGHIIVPTRTISRFLTDMVGGRDILELSTMIKDEARVFSFVAGSEDEGLVSELKLPEAARVVCYYRDGKFMLADGESKLKERDEVVVLTHSKNLPGLKERWAPKVDNARA